MQTTQSTRSTFPKLGLCSLLALLLNLGAFVAVRAAGDCVTSGNQVTCTFPYTGGAQAWTIPTGVTRATFDLFGAEGGRKGGLGGQARATLSLPSVPALQVNVGGRGGAFGEAGFNGGAPGTNAGGGGGASDVRANGTILMVAGGGGGGARGSNGDIAGGPGGGFTGGDGHPGLDPGGQHGNSTSGGRGGIGACATGSAGQVGVGGPGGGAESGGPGACLFPGGGGGGGYFGGGGGGADTFNGGGGGGGSGFIMPSATMPLLTTGVNPGDGRIVISYVLPDTVAPTYKARLSPPANRAGWNNSDVTITWNWDDEGGVGIDPDHCTASSSLSDEGTFIPTASCQDLAGNLGNASFDLVQIDKTPPSLAPVVSPNPVAPGEAATVSANATDTRSGLASQQCDAVDTSTVGVKSVSCTATDNADNTTSATVHYTVGSTGCLAGSYLNGTSCIPAPPGSFVASDGATAATPCAPGSYQDKAGQTSCIPAPPGYFVDTTGATAATPCAIGTFQAQAGQRNCTPAPAGSYVDTMGALAATPCAPGSYQDQAGQSSCKPAPPGSYVAIVGAITALPCAVGSYQSIAGQSNCLFAPVDTFVALVGAVTPTLCPADTYQDQSGQAFCLPLPTISALSPATVPAGGESFILIVHGTNFPTGAQVLWNGAPLETTAVSAMQLTGRVPSGNIATGGEAAITVIKPPSTRPSSAHAFSVTTAQPPVITIAVDAQPDSKTNFKFTGGLGRFTLDDSTPADNDAHTNRKSFTVAPGGYTVAATQVNGWFVTAITCDPATKGMADLPTRQVTVNATLGDNITCTFTVQRAGRLLVGKYNDHNHNGVRNGKDEWLPGWQMALLTETGAPLATQSTDTKGRTTFSSLAPGQYTLCETLQAGWFNITPNVLHPNHQQPCYRVTVNPGQAVAVRFGNSTTPLGVNRESQTFSDVIVMALPDTDDEGQEVTPLPDPWPDGAAEQVNALFLPLVTR